MSLDQERIRTITALHSCIPGNSDVNACFPSSNAALVLVGDLDGTLELSLA